MILTALLTGISVLLAALAALFIALHLFKREKQRILATIKLYFESPDNNTPSQFALLTDAIAHQIASAIVASAKGTLMGMQSVDSKNARKLESDLMLDMATAQSPIIGMLLKQFPTVAKRIQKNPEMLPYVQQLMSKISSGSGGSEKVDGHNNDGRQSSFLGTL